MTESYCQSQALLLITALLAFQPAFAGDLPLRPLAEPREGAFTLLVPEGWTAEGGVTRAVASPMPYNSGVNVDFVIRSDAAGTAMMHWFPNIAYQDPRGLRPGDELAADTYMGAFVHPVVDPETYLVRFVFLPAHPHAQDLRIVERRPMPELAQACRPKDFTGTSRFEGGLLTVTYIENGVRFQERLVAVIEERLTGLWRNHETLSMRAPAAEFGTMGPLFERIRMSLQANPEWVIDERYAEAWRNRMDRGLQHYIDETWRSIAEHTRRTNARIREADGAEWER